MNLSDVARITRTAQQAVKDLDKHGQAIFRSTRDWQSPLRSGSGPGCKNDHADPTGRTVVNPDPLALEHGLLCAELNALHHAAEAISARLLRLAPVNPAEVERGRVNTTPACLVCGGPAIPVRRGLCDRCRQAHRRAGQPPLEDFKRLRQRELEAARVVVHEHEVA